MYGNKPIEIVQLDYYTGEYVGEYASVCEAAKDNNVAAHSIRTSIQKNIRMRSCKLFFLKKVDYNPKMDFSQKIKLINCYEKLLSALDDEYEIIEELNNQFIVKTKDGKLLKYPKNMFSSGMNYGA
ncbi:hypothetical protein QTL86_03340 [Cellulosilyticum sp. ST5]|uniref:hypothetical protein n=1 Tax=Cellulosilyticum sp. ST5 TaxID=3055805 RepID=UPI0039776F2C